MSTGPDNARISLQDAASVLGASVKTVRRCIADGSLPAERIKGSHLIRVKRSDVEALLTPVPTVDRSGAS
ncbi:helix-turn-helix domain-containing protein [Pimelobacter simplex]|uniref:helix-turn-helix domain-containing protein n=1 Tax=Nocardioides simplex TaxID=2045 RepID=UPI00214F6200|nr:helix-turn-helix domain-containing protein [Pimelobacter simplex]UUW88350.1 helix-turn-helix domain-containing protein [Pimelobacter simplex]UUW97854.1 helix-turn-helix domain-containing protein [Pimelobacter simplex]